MVHDTEIGVDHLPSSVNGFSAPIKFVPAAVCLSSVLLTEVHVSCMFFCSCSHSVSSFQQLPGGSAHLQTKRDKCRNLSELPLQNDQSVFSASVWSSFQAIGGSMALMCQVLDLGEKRAGKCIETR